MIVRSAGREQVTEMRLRSPLPTQLLELSDSGTTEAMTTLSHTSHRDCPSSDGNARVISEPSEAKRVELTEALTSLWRLTEQARNIAEPDGDVPPLLFMHCPEDYFVAFDVSPFINIPNRDVVGYFIQRLVAGHSRLPATVTLMTMAYLRKADVDGRPMGEREECLMLHMETPEGHYADLTSRVERREGAGPVFSEPVIAVRSGDQHLGGALVDFYRLVRERAIEEGASRTKQ